ncbi:MAG: hypothetical protein WAP74_02735 [Patescibacteria group bacterium]
MKHMVREILTKIGPNGNKRLAAWQHTPGNHDWFVQGFVTGLGEQYRTAAEWLASELDRDGELGKDIADGLTSNPETMIRLFVRSVPERLGTQNNLDGGTSATVAQLQATVHNLERRITDVEEVMRGNSTSSTQSAQEITWILETLGYGSLTEVKSKPQRTKIAELAHTWQGLAQRQVVNNTQGEINQGRLKPKKGA